MFTEEDAQDDGKIKRQAGPQMVSTARRSSPQVFDAFQNICDQIGQQPKIVLSDMLIKALNDDDYAQRILETEVTMEKLQTGEYRIEDIERVQELAEAFDLKPDTKNDPVQDLIESRLEAVGGGPLGARNGDGSDDRKVKRLEQKIERLEAKLEQEAGADVVEVEEEVEEEDQTTTEVTENKKDLDDVLSDDTKIDDEEEEDEEEGIDDFSLDIGGGEEDVEEVEDIDGDLEDAVSIDDEPIEVEETEEEVTEMDEGDGEEEDEEVEE